MKTIEELDLDECKILVERGDVEELSTRKLSSRDDHDRDFYYNFAIGLGANFIGLPKNKDGEYIFYQRAYPKGYVQLI